MSEQASTKETYTYLSQQPGIQLIKAGTYSQIELDEVLKVPGLKSQIIDVPISAEERPLALGYFSMQPSEDFLFEYTYLEVKVVVSGQIIVSDEQGTKYIGEAGDVFIFTPNTNVLFHKESNGHAVFTGHRAPEPMFM